ncbi:hypothetical protein [Streptomyces collinus]|uniref:hypothetical protein n=1 Tax=Streptomyces collinus TaxID=42684 RepID=UPI003320DBEE
MKALVLHCTLKRSPEPSNTEALGNEDGAHHVISEVSGALADIGSTEDERGREWSHRTARAMAANLHGVATALAGRPVGAPPG